MERRESTSGGGLTAIAGGVNEFGTGLLRVIRADAPRDNVVLSPISVALGLAMALAGAAGSTATEIASALGVPTGIDPDTYHQSMGIMLGDLTSRFADVSNADGRHEHEIHAQLNIANSLWGQVDEEWRPSFLELLETRYRSPLETVDFVGDPDAARASMNRWVERATDGRITRLVGESSIDLLTRMVLLNAVHLKASWSSSFFADHTSESSFVTATGEVVEVAMMHQTCTTGYAIGNGWRSVDLAYVVPGVSLTAVVTKAGFPTPTLDEITAALSPGRVELSFPRFEFTTTESLSYALATLGLSSAFTLGADFSAMSTGEPLHIDDVIHRAYISVDENGTEAAAATAVTAMAAGILIEDPVVITFDHPFTFWLRDSTTGVVIFAGHVADPSSSTRDAPDRDR